MIRKRVCILGSGNAGLYAAIMLKTQRRGLDVQVVGSQEIGIVGVGESSTEHVSYVMKALGLTTEEIIKECHATFKFGVWFDWQKEQYVHSLINSNFDIGGGTLMGGFSGGTHGFSIGHIGPEAAVGGPIGLIKNGDVIEIDADKGVLKVNLSIKELKKRKKKWKPKKLNIHQALFGNILNLLDQLLKVQ